MKRTIGDQIRDRKIERGAKALREHQMAGRFTVEWEKVPKSQRKKWIEAATAVLEAAETIDPASS